jgi:hypothetical protein
LSEEVFPFVIGLNSAHEVWQALASAFGTVSQNRQLQIHIEFQELQKGDLTVSQFLQKAKALADELAAAGRPLSTSEFNAVIYRNIGYEYHAIITALNLRPQPISFYDLHGHLVAHEILLKSSHEPVANYSYRPPHSSAPLLPTPNTAPRTRPFNPQFNSRSRPTCQICGYRNHTTANCHRKYHRTTPSAGTTTSPTANMVTTAPSQPSWVPDTAANYHI